MDPSNYSQCVSQNYAKITKIMNTTIEKLNEIQKGKDNLGVSDFIVIFLHWNLAEIFFCFVEKIHIFKFSSWNEKNSNQDMICTCLSIFQFWWKKLILRCFFIHSESILIHTYYLPKYIYFRNSKFRKMRFLWQSLPEWDSLSIGVQPCFWHTN